MNQHKPALFVVCIAPQAIEWFFNGHLEALRDRYRVTVLTNLGLFPELTKLDNVNYISVPSERAVSVFKDMVSLFVIGKIIVSLRPQTVIGLSSKSSLLSLPLSRLFGVRDRVHIFQGSIWQSKVGLSRCFLKCVDMLNVQLATKVLSVSQSNTAMLMEQNVLPETKICYTPGPGSICGLRKSIYQAALNSCADLPRADKVTIGYFGRIHPDKGIDITFKVSEKLLINYGIPHKLIIGGLIDGYDPSHLMSQLTHLREKVGVEVEWIQGFLDPSLFFPKIDILFFPSFREGFGLVIVEAAAFGVPAVGNRISGVSDAIIENVTGVLSGPLEEDYASDLAGLITSRDYIRLGKAARQRSLSVFQEKKIVNAWLSAIFYDDDE